MIMSWPAMLSLQAMDSQLFSGVSAIALSVLRVYRYREEDDEIVDSLEPTLVEGNMALSGGGIASVENWPGAQG